jgi:oligosaccharyltransferase complex subunit delta (ribophorin II)
MPAWAPSSRSTSVNYLLPGFHAGLGAIFTLYLYFWLQLNMFETIKYLVVIGVVTFLCGNSLLATIAKKNK